MLDDAWHQDTTLRLQRHEQRDCARVQSHCPGHRVLHLMGQFVELRDISISISPLGSSMTSPSRACCLCSTASTRRSCASVRPSYARRRASLELTRGSNRSRRWPAMLLASPAAAAPEESPLPPAATMAVLPLAPVEPVTPGDRTAAARPPAPLLPGIGSISTPEPDLGREPGLVRTGRPPTMS